MLRAASKLNLFAVSYILLHAPCGLGSGACCRINPPRFLAECRMRWLNHGSFILLYLCCLLFWVVLSFSNVCFKFVFCQVNGTVQSNCADVLLRICSLIHSLYLTLTELFGLCTSDIVRRHCDDCRLRNHCAELDVKSCSTQLNSRC